MNRYFKKLLALFLLVINLSPWAGHAFNPCNEITFGFYTYVFPDYAETWNAARTLKTENPLCPPWNKRARSGCLKQFGLPGAWEITYNRYCAEASGRNSYFDPQIKVRIQTCNLACWTFSHHLSGDGECTIYPGPFGIPTMRICARIALPAEPKTDTPADHGYTYAWHLGPEGVPQQDPIYTGDDGQPVYHARPKICAYWDPSIYDALANYAAFLFGGALAMGATAMSAVNTAGLDTPAIVNEFIAATGVDPSSAARESANLLDMLQANLQPDLWDFNPVNQSTHFHEGGIFFLFDLLIQVIKIGVALNDMVNTILDAFPALKYIVYIISQTYWIIQLVMIIGKHIMIPVLEYLGQFNNVVTATLGCAMIPLGPYPPPYCDTIKLPTAEPSLTPICKTTADGEEAPNSVNKCVVSDKKNNVIKNTVRVGFRDLMSLCEPGVAASDTCVKLHPNLEASVFHAATGKTGVVQVCNEAKDNVPCVESPRLLERCAIDGNWCKQGIRIIYTLQAKGAMPLMKDYFDSTAPVCSPTSATCQGIWGVNIGNWRDITLSFPEEETGYSTSDLTSPTYSLEDPDGKIYKFKLMIPRTEREFRGDDLEPSNLYLMSDDLFKVVDSVTRPHAPKPTVYECGSQGVNCISHHLRPGIVAKIQVGADSTKGKLSAETHLRRPPGTVANSKLNLAGYDFTAFVTDDQLRQSPFNDLNTVNPATRLGDYVGDEMPLYDQDGNLNPPSAVYTGGLEYFQNKYVMGGELVCLSGYQFDDCLTSPTNENCVLANKTNSDLVKCTDFANRVSTRYGGMGICNDDQASDYTIIENVSIAKPVSGKMNIAIKGETLQGPYCYDYADRKTKGALCEPILLSSGRVAPSPALGDVLDDSEHYDYDRSSPPSLDTLVVRNKTAIEHGVCVDVPKPEPCKTITEAFAKWEPVPVGNVSVGTCTQGTAKGPKALERVCTINRSTLQSVWEPLRPGMGCNDKCSVKTNFATKEYNNSNKRLSLFTGFHSGNRSYKIKFKLDNVNDINRIILEKVTTVGGYEVIVNGRRVIKQNSGISFITQMLVKVNIVLNNFLVKGENEIILNSTISGGGMQVKLDLIYDKKDCNSISFDPISN